MAAKPLTKEGDAIYGNIDVTLGNIRGDDFCRCVNNLGRGSYKSHNKKITAPLYPNRLARS